MESLAMDLNNLEARARKDCDFEVLNVIHKTRVLMSENEELYESLDSIKDAVAESVKSLKEVIA